MRAVWFVLAKEDIGDQHRRTYLGPLWLLVSYLLFAGTFIFVFAQNTSAVYATHAAIGLFIWFYFTDVVTSASTLFVREEAFIKGTRLPLSVYVYRLTMQSVIRAAYSLIGCLAILLVAGIPVTLSWLWSVFGLLLIVITAPAVILIFAILGVFMPDSQDITRFLMRIGMFLTPIFWELKPGQQGIRALLYHFDPFTYYMEIVRQPIQSGTVSVSYWLVCLGISIIIWLIGIFAFGAVRNKLVFYL